MKFFIRSIKKHLMQCENRKPEGKPMHQFYGDVIFVDGIMNNNAYIFL
jgi:hypothetical protein